MWHVSVTLLPVCFVSMYLERVMHLRVFESRLEIIVISIASQGMPMAGHLLLCIVNFHDNSRESIYKIPTLLMKYSLT